MDTCGRPRDHHSDSWRSPTWPTTFLPDTEAARDYRKGVRTTSIELLIPQRRFQKRPQPMAPARVPQFPQRLCLDLPDALARHREALADLFERVFAAVLQAETHLDDLLFARAQRLEHFRRLLAQVQIDHRLRGRYHAPVHDEVAQMRLFFFAHRCFERNRLLRDAQNLADLAHRQFHLDG